MERSSVQSPTGPDTWGFVVPYIYIYINDLSKCVTDKSIPIRFADDTSFILTIYDDSKLRHKANEVFNVINNWFYSNSLMLKYNKTYFFAISN